MSDREAYERKIEAMLPEWVDRIGFMETRVSAIPAERRPVYEGLIKRMRETHREAGSLLGQAKAAPDASWKEAHGKLSRAWADLTNAYEKALCQFEGVKN